MKYKKKVYGYDQHAEHLLEALEQPNGPCSKCVGKGVGWTKKGFTKYHDLWRRTGPRQVCIICRGFVGLKTVSAAPLCPCAQLGDDAIKRSWLALEERGYLD